VADDLEVELISRLSIEALSFEGQRIAKRINIEKP
jgi:hypothetical protein